MRSQSFDGMVFSDPLRAKLYSPALQEAAAQGHKRAAFNAIIANSLRDDPFDTAQALVINTWLTGNALLNCDKVTMAHSLEARVPFFDPLLMAFAAAAPSDIRMKSNKFMLREAMRPLLPEFAIERPKQPFGTPILYWFANDLKGRIEERLLDQGAFIRQWFDPQALERLLRGHFNNTAPQVEVVFRLLTLEAWGQVFVQSVHQ
jgi:asparagine synthase (glutamine-hydrolysing)